MPGAYADRYRPPPDPAAGLALCRCSHCWWRCCTISRWCCWRARWAGCWRRGLMVAPMAIVRDLYEGDAMARLMRVIAAVFITVPVIAPSLGQAMLLVAGWRWIFVGAGGHAACWRRCGCGSACPKPCTRHNRQDIKLPVIARNMHAALINRRLDRLCAGHLAGDRRGVWLYQFRTAAVYRAFRGGRQHFRWCSAPRRG